MADAPATPVTETTPAPSPGGASDAVVATSPATSVETPAVAPTLFEKFDAEQASAKTPQPVEPVIEAPKPDDAPKPVEPVAEAPKPDEVKTEAKTPEPQAETPKEPEPVTLAPIEYTEHIKLPETLTLTDPVKEELYGALDAFRADPTLGAQELVNLHEREMSRFAQETTRKQYEVWNETRSKWQTDVMADPEIGGSGFQTAMVEVARVRDIGVPEKDRAAFSEFLSVTGAGDHPAFLKMMHNLGRVLNEGGMPSTNITPPADLGAKPGNRRATLYDNPRSNPNR